MQVPSQSQLLNAAQVQRLASFNKVPPCDVVVIYGSTLSQGVSTVGIEGGLSHADDAVTATLHNEMLAMRPLASAWHFLVIDGDPSTPVGAAWQQAIESKLVLSYECLNIEEGTTGLCLGTYRRGEHPHVATAKADNYKPRNIFKSYLSSRDYLSVGERLGSKDGSYYLAMQGDGNLVIYSTVYEPSGAATAIWSSRTPYVLSYVKIRVTLSPGVCNNLVCDCCRGDTGNYFLLLRPDSNLAVYPGRAGTVEGPPTWVTKSTATSDIDGFYVEM